MLTDFPDSYFNGSFFRKIWQFELERYDYYIFLTQHMNEIINKKNKPYIIIDGVCDSIDNSVRDKYEKFVLLYAGGLYEKYGVKNLVDAVLKFENDDIELHIYGSGDMEEYLKGLNDSKIKYYGVVKNNIILEEEYKSILLVNPRFTNQDYTKYSFPSKNMEYMASGTAVLTTQLQGIPNEYFMYYYTFENESIDGMYNTINKLLQMDRDLLIKKGHDAKEYVIKYKNKIVQSKKIIDMLDEGM